MTVVEHNSLTPYQKEMLDKMERLIKALEALKED